MAPDNGQGLLGNQRHAGWREQVLLRVLTGAIVLGGFIAVVFAYDLLVSPNPTPLLDTESCAL